jgi:peptide/nickel transport system substrate-binding protein
MPNGRQHRCHVSFVLTGRRERRASPNHVTGGLRANCAAITLTNYKGEKAVPHYASLLHRSTAAANSRRRRTGPIAIGAVSVLSVIGMLSLSVGDSFAATPKSSTNTLTIVTPDTGITFAEDADPGGGLEIAANLQASLLQYPYIQGSTGTLEQDVNKVVPYLASGYTVSADGLVYTFKLRDAISAAGDHLTSEDVIWSWERHFATALGAIKGSAAPVIVDPATQINAINAHTVSFTIAEKQYGSVLLALMTGTLSQIYDATLLKKHVTKADPWAVEWSANNPNYGFGPYEVTSYVAGVQADLTANPHFVLGPPKIKHVVVKIVPDAGTRANLVRTGEAQLAENLVPADLASLESGSGTKTGKVDNPNSYLMIPLVVNKAPFNNPAVRRAFAYAVPYRQIVNDVYYRLAFRNGPSFLSKTAPGYDGSGFTDFKYNPAMAKKLLAKTGFANGVSFTLDVSAAQPDQEQAAIQIQTFAKAAGFNVTIEQLPAAEFGTGFSAHTFQAYLINTKANIVQPGYELGFATSPTGGYNLADWMDPTFYAALATANGYPNPLSKAGGKLFNAAQRILVNSAPIIFVAQMQPTVGISSKLYGFAWTTDSRVNYDNLSFANS